MGSFKYISKAGNMQLPTFIYHLDPISTGSFISSNAKCKVCGQIREFIYIGPVYAIEREKLDKSICPWCIADGSAHKKFNAMFTNAEGIGGCGVWDNVPTEVIEHIAFQTPVFQDGNKKCGLLIAMMLPLSLDASDIKS
jgi:uncharacterized protein CbrC (UPF0167 family)